MHRSQGLCARRPTVQGDRHGRAFFNVERMVFVDSVLGIRVKNEIHPHTEYRIPNQRLFLPQKLSQWPGPQTLTAETNLHRIYTYMTNKTTVRF